MMTSSHPELVRQLKSEVDKVVERWAQNVLARASPAQETATEAEATATIAALLEQKDTLQEEVDVKAAHIAALFAAGECEPPPTRRGGALRLGPLGLWPEAG